MEAAARSKTASASRWRKRRPCWRFRSRRRRPAATRSPCTSSRRSSRPCARRRAAKRRRRSAERGLADGGVALPAGALVEGENKITLGFAQSGKFGDKKASAAVEWIDIGARVNGDSAAVVGDDKGLPLPNDGGLAYYVRSRPAARSSARGVGGCGCTSTRAAKRGRGQARGHARRRRAVRSRAALRRGVVRLSLTRRRQRLRGATLAGRADRAGDGARWSSATRDRKNIIFWLTDDTRTRQVQDLQPEDARRDAGHRRARQDARPIRCRLRAGQRVARLARQPVDLALPAQHQFISEKAKLDPKFVTLRRGPQAGGPATPPASWPTASSTRSGDSATAGICSRTTFTKGGGLKAETS